MSNLFSLNRQDFVKGAVTAIFAAIVMTLANASQQPGFNIASIDWNVILNVAIGAFIGYLGKNFATDAQGNPLGIKI